MSRRERVEEMVPNIVPIEAIDEDVPTEVQEVYSGSSHRHLRSSVSTSKFSDEEASAEEDQSETVVPSQICGYEGEQHPNVVDGEKRRSATK